ncbi:MAG TPA: AAA family ATPase [Vicinamibacteria bacterium]|nr:AAA family ATPase [Vicinamibacteria bacterium]
MNKIAIAGKGGTGKTTLAGTLARLIARTGREVWAIDADSNPNLAVTLGLQESSTSELIPIPRTILSESTDENGKRKLELGMPAREVRDRFGMTGPDNVALLVMGKVDHAGAG